MFSFRTAFRQSFADAIILLVYFDRSTLINTLPPLIGNNFHQNVPTKRNRSSSLKIPILVQFLDQRIFYNLTEFFSAFSYFRQASSARVYRRIDCTMKSSSEMGNFRRKLGCETSMIPWHGKSMSRKAQQQVRGIGGVNRVTVVFVSASTATIIHQRWLTRVTGERRGN